MVRLLSSALSRSFHIIIQWKSHRKGQLSELPSTVKEGFLKIFDLKCVVNTYSQ